MNPHVFLLFFDVMFTMLCVAGIVLWILRREYLPVIRRLEAEDGPHSAGVTDSDSNPASGD